jgi:hypothetical protein
MPYIAAGDSKNGINVVDLLYGKGGYPSRKYGVTAGNKAVIVSLTCPYISFEVFGQQAAVRVSGIILVLPIYSGFVVCL